RHHRPRHPFPPRRSSDLGIELLGRSPRPTAIVAANDLMALGAMKAAYSKGIRVPDDVSIVGFDDIDSASHVTPSLTTVRQPKYEDRKSTRLHSSHVKTSY